MNTPKRQALLQKAIVPGDSVLRGPPAQRTDSAQARRRWLATQLAALVATAGLIPIVLVGSFALRTLRVRARADARLPPQADEARAREDNGIQFAAIQAARSRVWL